MPGEQTDAVLEKLVELATLRDAGSLSSEEFDVSADDLLSLPPHRACQIVPAPMFESSRSPGWSDPWSAVPDRERAVTGDTRAASRADLSGGTESVPTSLPATQVSVGVFPPTPMSAVRRRWRAAAPEALVRRHSGAAAARGAASDETSGEPHSMAVPSESRNRVGNETKPRGPAHAPKMVAHRGIQPGSYWDRSLGPLRTAPARGATDDLRWSRLHKYRSKVARRRS